MTKFKALLVSKEWEGVVMKRSTIFLVLVTISTLFLVLNHRNEMTVSSEVEMKQWTCFECVAVSRIWMAWSSRTLFTCWHLLNSSRLGSKAGETVMTPRSYYYRNLMRAVYRAEYVPGVRISFVLGKSTEEEMKVIYAESKVHKDIIILETEVIDLPWSTKFEFKFLGEYESRENVSILQVHGCDNGKIQNSLNNHRILTQTRTLTLLLWNVTVTAGSIS